MAALAGCAESPEPPAPAPPNVLLIVLDTVRRDHLSTYGYPRTTTPHLSRLAAAGARYDDVLAPAPWTVPSHATLMTGLPPAVHGAHHEHPVLGPDVTTLAERFAAAGWRTGGFSANPFVGRPARLDRGFEVFRRIDEGGRAVNAAILEFVDRRGKTDEPSKANDTHAPDAPWFVFANYMEAHMPYVGLPEDVRLRFMPGTPESIKLSPLEAQTDAHLYACGEKAPSPELLATLVDLYDAALAHLDAIVGELLGELELEDANTIVVVVSDHGELLGENGRVEHQWSLLEPLLRVPLIVKAPGRLEAGSTIDAPMGLADVHDLVLDLAGIGTPSDAQRATGERVAEYHRPLRLLKGVGELEPGCEEKLDRRLVAVRDGRFKLEWSSNGAPSLYDLETDPGEQIDVAAEHPEHVVRLVGLAEARRRLALGAAGGAPVPELDAEERERLRVLGYLPGDPPGDGPGETQETSASTEAP